MDLFQNNVHDASESILHINNKLSVERAEGKWIFRLFEEPIFQVRHSDAEGMKFVLAQLTSSGLATNKELSDAVGIHRNTISEGVRILRSGCLRDFARKRAGPKGPSKLKPQIKKLIITTHLSRPELAPGALAQVVSARLLHTVSENSIRDELLETGFLRPRKAEPGYDDQPCDRRELDLPTLWDSVGEGSRQMVFQFPPSCPQRPATEGVAQASSPSLVRTAVPAASEDDVEPTSLRAVCSTSRKPAYRPEARTLRDRRHLKELRQGLHSRDAAALIYTPILNEFDFTSIVASVLDACLSSPGQTYTPSDMCLMQVFANALGYQSVESFQDTKRRELGPLIGHYRSPDLRTHRRFLAAVGEHELSEALMDRFAQQWFERGRTEYGVFYVDEHFIPYWGQWRLDYGHHPIRRLAMKGNNEFFINDIAQRPVHLMLTPGHVKLSSVLPKVAAKLRALRGMDAEAEATVGCPLTLLVDRGGASPKVFKTLQASDVRFITYLEQPESKASCS